MAQLLLFHPEMAAARTDCPVSKSMEAMDHCLREETQGGRGYPPMVQGQATKPFHNHSQDRLRYQLALKNGESEERLWV